MSAIFIAHSNPHVATLFFAFSSLYQPQQCTIIRNKSSGTRFPVRPCSLACTGMPVFSFGTPPTSGNGDSRASAEDRAISHQPIAHQPAIDPRPGAFEDPKNFAENLDSCRLSFQPCTRDPPQIGDVVYLKSSDMEMDCRIMLIIRMTKTSTTCLTFCRHDGRQQAPDDHWTVTAKNAGLDNDITSRAVAADTNLNISLLKGGELSKGVFINLNEPWTVPFHKTEMSVIAEVPRREFVRFSKEATRLFEAGMRLQGNDLPAAEPVERVASRESTNERRSRKHRTSETPPSSRGWVRQKNS